MRVLTIALLFLMATAQAEPTATSFRLPTPPDGLRVSQCWYSLGSAPDGSIYITASDHKTNAALFGKSPLADRFEYLGDARSASSAAGNWPEGETLEKFHVRPTHFAGDIYLGGLNFSFYNKGYRKKRGFRWYVYRPKQREFVDLSAAEPGGIASPFQLEHLIAAPRLGKLFGAAVPRGHLLSYDPASGKTTDYGRPPGLERNYPPSDSFLWTDSQGRVYFAMEGRDDWFARIHYYDTRSGHFGSQPDWALRGPSPLTRSERRARQVKQGLKPAPIGRIPKVGQCTAEGDRCYMADTSGRIYRWSERPGDANWQMLGQVKFPRPHETAILVTRTFHLDADERYIYLVNERYHGTPDVFLHRFDITTGQSSVLARLADLAPETNRDGFNLHCGHDAWDQKGRFYIGSFSLSKTAPNVLVTAIKP